MAEIRLICPGCSAEYRIPETAIPPEGREVECSACNNVWLATPAPNRHDGTTERQSQPPGGAVLDLPRLNRRLPDTVLDILRGEVEHERRARATGDPADTPSPRPDPSSQPVADPEWPATTITRHADLSPVRIPFPVPTELETEHEPEPVAPVLPIRPPQPHPEPAAEAPRETSPPILAEAVRPDRPSDNPVLRARSPVRAGYAAGFGLAATLAASLVGLYLLAPLMADRGALGDGVTAFRAQADDARLWLQDRAASLTR